MIYNTNNFDINIIKQAPTQKRRKGNQGTRRKLKKYKDLICAFDIETTNDLKINQAWMYIWQMQIGEYTIIGRTWEEFLKFLRRIASVLDPDVYLMIFVHNLSFEFQFLKGIYKFKKEEVFATEPRKVLKCEMMDHFEFRCSYFQTNMSLDEFTHKMGVESTKLSGEEFNYKKMRYPWTKLTKEELHYCINDVKGLVQAMKIQMELENDSLYTIPLTSTGYVRRDVKAAMRHYDRHDLKLQLPDPEIYMMLLEAFRGGNTHANRYYAEFIQDNVSTYDIVSSYPTVQLTEKFPMSPWLREENVDLDQVIRRIVKHERACLMRARIWNIELTDKLWGCPYIPFSKCRNVINPEKDNGRILSADYLEITITDIDLKIILDEYTFQYIDFPDFYHSRYAPLPKPLRDVVYSYFEKKTALKGVPGQELYYMKAKNKLNAIYGMTVTKVKDDCLFIDGEFTYQFSDYAELVLEANKHAFLNYAWGVWTTAHARMRLESAMRFVGNDFVYCDTDSVKFLGEHDFDILNRELKAKAKESGAYATDPQGVTHYMGVFENDGHYKQFITKGAKKYAVVNDDGSITITVAGVGKKKGAEELAAAGGLKAFKDGFTFYKAGGTESVYNDYPEIKEIRRYGHTMRITSNLLIRDSTYTLGVAADYRRLLENVKFWREFEFPY